MRLGELPGAETIDVTDGAAADASPGSRAATEPAGARP